MGAERVRALLDEQGLAYELHDHPEAVTAQQMAAAEHTSGWHVAKPVLLRADGELVMVVLPAPTHVDLEAAARVLGAEEVRLADEAEFTNQFPDCETGAEPPFGNVYGMPVVLDERMADHPEITFAAGSHTQSMTLRLADYLKAVEPRRARLSVVPDLAG